MKISKESCFLLRSEFDPGFNINLARYYLQSQLVIFNKIFVPREKKIRLGFFFDGILTFVSYLMPKTSMLRNSSDTNLPIWGGNKGGSYLSKGISS